MDMSDMKWLYKRTATGAIQMWALELRGAQYRSISGQLGGVATTSEWTTCKGKNIGRSNETTPAQQAAAEVESKYTLQRKKGYRDSAEEARSSKRFQCMLADKYEDRKDKLFDARGRVLQYDPQRDHNPGLWVQPKLDGIRCIANANGLWSRQGNRIVAAPHIEELLAPIFKKRPELIFDGELYNHDLKEDFNTIVSIVKKQKPTEQDLQRSANMIQYWVYDGLIEDRSERFYIRFINGVGPLARELGPMITDVPTNFVSERERLDTCYENWLLDGFEGMMIRLDAPYEQKRSKTLLKRKEFMDAEFEIIRIDEGVGNASGMAKIAHLKLENAYYTAIGKDGKEMKVPVDFFKADIVGTREELRELLKQADDLVGKQATIMFQNLTPDGVPRFPKLKIVHNTERW